MISRVRLFTVDEANELLPRIEPLLRTLMGQFHTLDEKRREHAETVQRGTSNGHSLSSKLAAQQQELQELGQQLEDGVVELEKHGCTVKDLSIGLLDFPGRREGQVVNLCWRLGEPRVAYWHSLETGYASRRPL